MPYRVGLSPGEKIMHHLTWPDALVFSVALVAGLLFGLLLIALVVGNRKR